MEHDGFSLDDKRQRVPENDIPDLLACWQHRHDPKFQKKRDARLADLQKQIAPLKADRLKHHAIIHRLKFEEVVAKNDGDKARTAREKAEAELAELNQRIAPLEKEINQLGRQFWVTKEQVAAQNYDLSASRYRQVEQEEVFYEKPAVTLERMRQLESFMRTAADELNELTEMVNDARIALEETLLRWSTGKAGTETFEVNHLCSSRLSPTETGGLDRYFGNFRVRESSS